MYFFSDFALYPLAVRKLQDTIITSLTTLSPDGLAYYFIEKTKKSEEYIFIFSPSTLPTYFHLCTASQSPAYPFKDCDPIFIL